MDSRLILFIHGLGGKPQSTWGAFESLLSADKDLVNVKVGYFSYPTSLFGLPFIGPKYPGVQTLAQALATQIKNRYASYRDITLVCHSLGGLIGKKYLIDCIESEEQLHVKRLLLYAVPNNGATLAGVAACISWRHRQLRQLCRDSDLIVEISKAWKRTEVEQRVDVRYILGAMDKVVDEHSTRETWANPKIDVLVDRGHMDAVKPLAATDMSYMILKNRMLQLTGNPQPAMTTTTSTPTSEDSVFDAVDDSHEVRVVVSAVIRIEDAGKYLVIRNTHRPESFAPVGGVYKYHHTAKPVLDTFCYRADAKDAEMHDDVRGFVNKGAFNQFKEWFAGEAHRETADACLLRELQEELGEVGLLPPELGDLRFRLVRSVSEGPEFISAMNYWQFRTFEIYDLEPSSVARALLEQLREHSKTCKDLLWVTADEIKKGRAHSREVVAPHACYFIGTKRHRANDPAM